VTPRLQSKIASRIVLASFAVMIAWIGFQLATGGHTGVLRTLSVARRLLRQTTSSPELKRPTASASPRAPHSVSLSWTPSPSAVVGYNVYRRGVLGSIRINSAPVTGTSYVDRSAQPGQTYYYATKAVSPAGTESAPSNEVQVVVPSP
jgi:hypothetical protein